MTQKTFVTCAPLAAALLFSTATSAQTFVISTFAGGPPGSLAAVAALKAALGETQFVVADDSDNIYFSTTLSCIFKVDKNGILTRIAGNGHAGFYGDGGPASQSALSFGAADINSFDGGALAIDAAGNLYVVDSGNQRVRKISTDGSIKTIAGGASQGYTNDGFPALSVAFQGVTAVAVDPSGNVYAADYNGIYKITPDGILHTIPGSPTFQGFVGLTMDAKGNLYVADQLGNQVLQVSTSGTILQIVGNGTAGYSGDGGPATSAELNSPVGLAVDLAGNLYIADAGNSLIRKVTPDGNIHTIAGGAHQLGDGGPATSAQLLYPYGVAVDGAGNVIIADVGHNSIREVSPSGTISTIAGNGGWGFAGDGGPAKNAQFGISLSSSQPIWGGALAVDDKGDLYIADTANLRIRMISPDGNIQTVAGTGTTNEDTGDGGAAVAATINYPYGLAADSAGNFYIGDGIIRKVSASGVITTVALNGSRGLTVDASSNLYFSGVKLTPNGTLTQSAGGWASAVDSDGNLFAADINGYVVRKIAKDGTITVVAGDGTPGFSGDGGQATSAQLNTPTAIAVDIIGDLFIADCFNQRIRIVTPDGIISTIAGYGSQGYSGDGSVAINAQFGLISGMAVDRTGNLYLADQTYNAIRLVQWQPASQQSWVQR
jgi:trimeric autotransporter adhesin